MNNEEWFAAVMLAIIFALLILFTQPMGFDLNLSALR
jgi:hypothetical protein